MKKLMISTVALVLTAATLSAQTPVAALSTDVNESNYKERSIRKEIREEKKELRKMEGNQVASLSKTNFFGDFGNVDGVTWKRSAYYDEATFTKGDITETAYYDDGSNLVGASSVKSFTDLPVNAQKSISHEYKDYKVANVVFFDDNEYNDTDMLLYGTRFDDEDNYFVELNKDNKQIVLRVNREGDIFFFKDLS